MLQTVHDTGEQKSNSIPNNSDLNCFTRSKLKYNYVCNFTESHQKPIFAIRFFPFEFSTNSNSKLGEIFATVGSNRASIYECASNSSNINLIQTYLDEAWDESFYACLWTVDQCNDNHPLLIIAGELGVIKVLDCKTKKLSKSIVGHGYLINHLSLHPSDMNIIVSSSKDNSIRIWNIQTLFCLAIIAGHDGHQDSVLCASFHLSGYYLVSCGLDNAIKIWNLNDAKQNMNMDALIQESYEINKLTHENTKPRFEKNGNFNENRNSNVTKLRKYHTRMMQFPVFSSKKIHSDYVDHCEFVGDLIISKSTESLIKIWKAPVKYEFAVDNEVECMTEEIKENKQMSAVTYAELRYEQSDIWFIRFTLDESKRILAVGNQIGEIFIWNLDDFFECNSNINMMMDDQESDDDYEWHTFLTPKFRCKYKPLKVSLPNCNVPIRSITFNQTGTMLISCENACVYRYDDISNANISGSEVNNDAIK